MPPVCSLTLVCVLAHTAGLHLSDSGWRFQLRFDLPEVLLPPLLAAVAPGDVRAAPPTPPTR